MLLDSWYTAEIYRSEAATCRQEAFRNYTGPSLYTYGTQKDENQPLATRLIVLSKVDVVLPEDLYDLIWSEIESRINNIQYSRVIMPLSALLEGDFFNSHIKSGITHTFYLPLLFALLGLLFCCVMV